MTIASEITRLQTAKANIKTSIEGKGVEVPSNAKLSDYPALVDSIATGGGDEIIDYMGGILSLNSGMIYISGSDDVQNRYGDYSWKDGTNIYLVKPYEYEDYSSSGSSSVITYVYCMALPKGASETINYDGSMYSGGRYTSTAIDYYYINGSSIRFYGRTGEYRDTYRCKEMTFSNGSWTMTDIGWDSTPPAQTGGNQNLFYSSIEGCTGHNCNFYFKWRPVTSS